MGMEYSGRKNLGELFEDLILWQRAVQMALEMYKLTADFPASERFGLTNQLRRPLFRSQATLRKVMEDRRRGNMFNFWVTQEAQTAKFKPNS